MYRPRRNFHDFEIVTGGRRVARLHTSLIRRTLELNELLVENEYRRRAIGEYLVGVAKDLTRYLGARVMKGVVRPFADVPREELEAFYERQGLRRAGTQDGKPVYKWRPDW